MTSNDEYVIQLLTERGYLASEQVEAARQSMKAANETTLDVLVAGGTIDEDSVLGTIADQFGLKYCHVNAEAISEEAAKSLSADIARKYGVVPVVADESSITVGLVDPMGYDAIDSLRDKALLIRLATASGARFFSSMGAALKMDPTRIRVTEFWKVTGDPLARALRNIFKRSRQFPARKFQCVFSDELLQNEEKMELEENQFHKVHANGSIAHITAIFGLTLAGLVVQDIYTFVSPST